MVKKGEYMNLSNFASMNIHYRFFDIEYFFKSARDNGLEKVELWLCPHHFSVDYLGYENPNS